jgi:hypothetical protein
VKHYFQYLFSGAVLLVALMISNGQKNESPNTVTGNPVTDHIELLAELSPGQYFGLTFSSCNHSSVLVKESLLDRHKDHESLDSAVNQTLLKTQMLIHLELKPGLDFQSGQILHHLSGFADPPSA